MTNQLVVHFPDGCCADGQLTCGEGPRAAKSHIYLDDVNSLVNLSGKQRTEAEYRALLATAGFELATITPLGGDEVPGRRGRDRPPPG